MRRTASIMMVIISLAVIGCSAIFLSREFTKVVNLCSMGDMWSFLYLRENSPYATFAEVDQDDFLHPPVPQEGDQLFEIDGLPSTHGNYFQVFNVDTPAGLEIPIKYLHDGEAFTTTVVTRSIPFIIQLQVWILLVLRTLIIAGLILVGLWGFMKKPASSSVRALSLFCYTLAFSMNVSSPSIADTYASFDIPNLFYRIMLAVPVFFPAFWLKLQLLFPSRLEWYRRHRLFANLLLFVPGAVFMSAYLIWGVQNHIEILILWSLQLALGCYLLVRNYLRAKTFIEKRQTRLVILGSATGIILILLFNWFITVFPYVYADLTFIAKMLMTNTLFFFMLLIPVSLAYAFGKYRLLSVEAKIKRGTRFVAVSLFLLLVFIALLFIFGNLVLRQLGISSRTPTLILGILLAFVFMPTQRKLHQKLEKHFYPEKVRLKNLLRNFLSSRAMITESCDFWKELEDKLADGLEAEKIYPVLRMVDRDCFAVENREPAPFDKKDELVKKLENTELPVLFDELIASGRISLSEEQKEWFMNRKSAILIPLKTNSGLVGFLVVSSKKNGEDFTPEELDLLANLSAQTALVAENFELLNEKLIKQKLQQQLSVARDIQKGLLPGKIPSRPCLEIEACIKFCLDVAGDYYDVIPLDDNRTILSIGDVAGKGVGPAMLMANLQASLKTTQEMGESLAVSTEKINKVVCCNTPSELFITFFVAEIDTADRTLKYVNAGHNPPLLVRRNGRVETLSSAGVVLGVRNTSSYREIDVSFNPGDILFMYTDGVSEAMDENGMEYGENRLVEILKENVQLPLADILSEIEKSVKAHHGSEQYEDDFTILAARIISSDIE
ncbi:MAG: SpoIIE family protein phosphatase [Candidatus Aegiribacteria sp.]|nr:SpoIIE family protein phosphatase [Candidatus Aegiribacteria sp.]MBD3295263.1 SpoIIE family protein phosphatase [Candidatus Fermentibacteria bacterium]